MGTQNNNKKNGDSLTQQAPHLVSREVSLLDLDPNSEVFKEVLHTVKPEDDSFP